LRWFSLKYVFSLLIKGFINLKFLTQLLKLGRAIASIAQSRWLRACFLTKS